MLIEDENYKESNETFLVTCFLRLWGLDVGHIVTNVHVAIVIHSGIQVIDGWSIGRNFVSSISKEIR